MEKEFKKIGIIGKLFGPRITESINELASYLTSRHCEVFIDQITAEELGINPKFQIVSRNDLGEHADLVIIVGGDGTFLNAARSLVQYEVPLLGFNLGHLGFLTDLSPTDINGKLDEILQGKYRGEPRGLLQTTIYRQGEMINQNCAFNDVVVQKWKSARMLEYETYIDEQFINSNRSDGLIVSTPTGSTGYALSGGGPILHPSLHAIVIVPICPHTMTYRPIVVYADSKIEIIVKDCNQGEAQVICDGQINIGVQRDDKIEITKYKTLVTLIHPKNYDYYAILRAKLHWGKRLSN